MSPQIAVFGASTTASDHPDYAAAVRCGALLAGAGYDVATGGYCGLMEAVSRGAASVGGHVVGITAPAIFPSRPGANEFVSEERAALTLTDRIHDLLQSSDGVIALQGSIGTLTEMMVAWNAAFIDALDGGPARPVIAVGDTWRDFVGMIGERLHTDASLVTCVPGIEAAVAEITRRVPIRSH